MYNNGECAVRKILVTLIALVVAMSVSSSNAQDQATRKDARAVWSAIRETVPVSGLWEDPETGCRYFVTNLPSLASLGSWSAIPTIRYRSDGKPDCRDVK